MGTPGIKMAVRNTKWGASDPRSVSEPKIALVPNSRPVDPCVIGRGRPAVVWKPCL